ncbi:formylglycine-generating enzyme family protein [Methylomonas sp. 11b]|uniref:formylglycine-generating enzyme family protein n=1 Tax=Methylomonas sp. 11b TaxID=1168169 RepID=UPI00047EB2F1|nr:formylglycine-generating enzyme family protein [Methylomonas sp. 11b]
MLSDNSSKAALGRAHLLQMLVDHADAGSERQMALADVLGFDFSSKIGQLKPEQGVTELTSQLPGFTSQTGTPRLPRGLFRPLHAQYLQVAASEEQWQNPASLANYGVLSDDDQLPWDEAACVPPFQPLVPWTRLWPRLHQTVSQRHKASVDVAGLTELLAQAKWVQRLPRQTRQTWPAKVHLILDFSDRLTPYWDDWHWLADNLSKLLKDRLLVSVLYRSDATALHSYSSPQTRPWPQPNSHQTLLIASDLGMLDNARPYARQIWQHRLQTFRRQGIPCLVAAPLAYSQLLAEAANLLPLLRLSSDSSLRPVAKLSPLHQANVYGDDDLAYRVLLTLLAMATRAEPALLRALRLSLPMQADNAGLEGAVWLDARLNTSAGACAVNEAVAAEWQRAFSALDAALQQQLLACLRRYHAGLPQMIHHEETLLWSSRVNPELAKSEHGHAQEARGFFHKLTQSLQEDDSGQYHRAARHLLLNMADHHLQHTAVSLSGEAYLNRLSVAVSRNRPMDTQPLPVGLDWAAWLQSQPDIPPQSVNLLQHQDGALVIDHTDFQIELGWQRLLTLKLDRQVLLWSVQKAGQTLHYRPWHWLQQPVLADPLLQSVALPLSQLHAGDLWLHTGRQQICLNQLVAPAWAKEWGVDRFGLYADLSFRSVTQRFRWIEPGSFMMGSPTSEIERYDDEVQHAVTLTKGFWLADTACTQLFWQTVMGENPSSLNDDPRKPVETVSWDDVQQFIEVLNRQTASLNSRLPKEAEWEYACRAGTETPFSFGVNITPQQVNYYGDRPYANGEEGEYRGTTMAVKSLPANAWGLFEMHGNVWEWCQDGWQETLGSEPMTDPLFDLQDLDLDRVMRGGSWITIGREVRSAFRGRYQSGNSDVEIGFRLALG